MRVINLRRWYSLRNLWRIIAFLAGVLVLSQLALSLFGSELLPRLSRVDKRNALQVTGPVIPDAAVVPASAPDFFVEYRLERDRVRSERADVLREVYQNARKDDSVRYEAQTAMLKLAVDRQRESEIENLIKARGFADALVFIRDKSVSVVVKTSNLNREEVAQVADIVSRVTGVKPEDIVISAKP